MTRETAPDRGVAGDAPVPAGEPVPFVIVLAYPDGRLDNAWFRAYKRVKRAMRTRGLAATVQLRPASDVPTGAAVVVAHDGLAGSAQLPPGHLLSSPDRLQPDVDGLLEGLVADGTLGFGPPASRSVAIHRGFLPVDGRARVKE